MSDKCVYGKAGVCSECDRYDLSCHPIHYKKRESELVIKQQENTTELFTNILEMMNILDKRISKLEREKT